MSAPLSDRLSTTRQLSLASFWFGISFLWGSFLAVVLPFILLPEHPGPGNPALVAASDKNTALAVLEGLGLVLAIVVQPAAGALSDRLRTRWGRRRPLILLGAAGGVAALLLMVSAASFWWVVGAYCLLQFCMNVGQGAYQGLMPDRVGSDQRGSASGWLGVATLSGQVAGVLAGGWLAPRAALVPIAAVVLVTALITVFFNPEPPLPPATRRERPTLQRSLAEVRGYVAEFRRYPDFCWVVLSRFLAYTGLACIQRFAANYLRDTFHDYHVFGINLGGAQAATGIVFAVVILCGLLATYPAVRLSERTGRRPILVAATVVGAAGSALFLVAGSLTVVVLVAMLVGVAWGMLVSVDWAYMVDLAPRDRSGKFLGFSNVATAGSQAAAPFALGPVIDAVNRSTGTGGYKVLFAAAAIFMLAGGAVLAQVRPRVAPGSGELVLASASD
ncbi:MAG: MFS transporter [Candidatus Dormibacteraeota bacterium]|nr:MFS transporter [Candidatus Dormibacteraeota bacterium]